MKVHCDATSVLDDVGWNARDVIVMLEIVSNNTKMSSYILINKNRLYPVMKQNEGENK